MSGFHPSVRQPSARFLQQLSDPETLKMRCATVSYFGSRNISDEIEMSRGEGFFIIPADEKKVNGVLGRELDFCSLNFFNSWDGRNAPRDYNCTF